MDDALVRGHLKEADMITNEDIVKFKEIYRNKYGIDISHDDAFEQSHSLVNFMKIVFSKNMLE